jgi:hypothetical protein
MDSTVAIACFFAHGITGAPGNSSGPFTIQAFAA